MGFPIDDSSFPYLEDQLSICVGCGFLSFSWICGRPWCLEKAPKHSKTILPNGGKRNGDESHGKKKTLTKKKPNPSLFVQEKVGPAKSKKTRWAKRNATHKTSSSFFQVTLWPPKWRSLNLWKGHLEPPKRVTGKNLVDRILLGKIRVSSMNKRKRHQVSSDQNSGYLLCIGDCTTQLNSLTYIYIYVYIMLY